MTRLPHAFVLMAGISLSACMAGPSEMPTAADVVLPPAFRFAPDERAEATLASLLPATDPAFRILSGAALADAPDLAIARARVEAARAASDRAGAERLPRLDANGTVERARTSAEQFGGNLPPGIEIDTTRTSYGANLVAGWDADIFGALRAQEQAAAFRAGAADADAAAVKLALIAEIAGSVTDWRTLSAREAALRADLGAAEDLGRLAGSRERAGIAPGFDRLRAETAAAASRSGIAALASERARLIGRLVTLTARPAEDVMRALAEPAPAETLMPAAPAALPSTLLTGRPDVLAAGARLRAADADLAATAARRFPRLNLSASIGLLAFGLGDLFDDDAIVGSVGAGLLGPILDFGRIAADIDVAEADTRAAFETYRAAVFTALGDSEAAYALVTAADRELAAISEEAERAQRSARLSDVRFRAGLENFLTVLEARRAADRSGERAAAARGRAMRARILLWQALGGDLATGGEQT